MKRVFNETRAFDNAKYICLLNWKRKTHNFILLLGAVGGGHENLVDRKEKYEIHKYRNATLAFVELASWPGLKLLGGSTNLPKQ